MMNRNYSMILAIDLGGSIARAAVMEGGKAVLIPNRSGGFGRPVAVGLGEGRFLVCEEALAQAAERPDRTALAFKRRMGGGEKLILEGKGYSAEALTALVLRRLRADAADYLGEDPEQAIITVPNSYTSLQRQAVIDAGYLAGLSVKRLINSSSAAALSYGCTQEGSSRILVCDLGSTSFDVSVLEVGDGMAEVWASGGDDRLGGDDFTECIVKWIRDGFCRSEGIDPDRDPAMLARVRLAAETAKRELSEHLSAQIRIPCGTTPSGKPLFAEQTLSRAVFNELTAPLRDRARELVWSVLNSTGLSPDGIRHVVFVGGGSCMPAMRDTLRQALGRDVFQPERPEECTARGAAVQAGVLSGDVKNVLLLEATTHSLGIETAGGVCTWLIPSNASYPITNTQSFSTAEDNQTTVEIHVLEGESDKAADNTSLGRFRITGIPPAAKGVPKIEVSFEIDQNGVIGVRAKDSGTGTERRLPPLDRPGFSKEQLQKAAAAIEQIAAGWTD